MYCGGIPDHPPSRPVCLILQHSEEGAPSLVEEGAVQSGLLTDVPTGSLDGSGGGGRHSLHVQVFDHDDRVVFADRRRDLVEEVVPCVGHVPVEPGEFFSGLGPVLRALFLAGKGALEPFQTVLVPGEKPSRGNHRSIGEGGEAGHAEIDPNDPGVRMNRRLDLPFGLDRDEPSVSGMADGDVLEPAGNGSALAVADPSDLREKDPGIGLVDLCALREPERILLTLPAERRKARPFLEEVPVRPVEVLEGLLENQGVDPGEPDGLRIPLPERGEGWTFRRSPDAPPRRRAGRSRGGVPGFGRTARLRRTAGRSIPVCRSVARRTGRLDGVSWLPFCYKPGHALYLRPKRRSFTALFR